MSSSAKKYDVFLNFRGEDTRSGFISCLYDALAKKLNKTFIDDQLPKGHDVRPVLLKAIEDSHVSIVVFSEDYASSTWCLEELVKILECRKDQGQVVIPVFYETDPSHIRKQTGSYEKAFAKHEPDLTDKDSESNKKKVLKWRAALTEAANISGWDSRTYQKESHLIENIVNDVKKKIGQKYPTELQGLGIVTERNCRKVESLMKDFQIIGIWGMGGVGKSTIAKVLFAKLFPQYDNVCFVEDAKEYSLAKLLSELFKEDSSKYLAVSAFNQRRLTSIKVLVVVDDVDSFDQLEYLCGENRYLSDDSRLLITTRDKQVLVKRVDKIYKVKEWKTTESLELFCLEAFQRSHPPEGYDDLSQKAVNYAGGVPLALKVLGSYLHGKRTRFWEGTFRKLGSFLNQKIQKVLQVSYDGLDPLEQKIFLDIAFFFEGRKKDHVVRILDACGFEASSGIEVLEDKALITISNSDRIQMQDLLQKMGLEIVRKECRANPGRRTRLRNEEARQVIEENKGTDSIEGITLDLSHIKDLPLRADTFAKMKALRFLEFYTPLGQSSSIAYPDQPRVLEPFSDKLRYFEWSGYPYESLPSRFCAKLLVEIHMPHSNVKQLWQGIQELHNLEVIDLSECKQFVRLPDLSKASRLTWVDLSGCESLRLLHPSVLSSDTLVTLILDRCTNLTNVKGQKHLKSLEKISVNGCVNLKEFAVSSELIENLDLSNTGIETLDKSIGSLHNLKWINLEGLRLRHLLTELASLKSLKELKLSDGVLVIEKEQLHVLFAGLRSLQMLHLKNCSNLSELPDNISDLSRLRELMLDGSNVKGLPESIKHLQKLETLSLENCRELLCLPELPPFIKLLRAVNCTSLRSVSNLNNLATEMMGKAKSISFKNSLTLDRDSLYAIMESLHLTMASAAFHNVLVRRHDVVKHSYNYNSIKACLPGGKVPKLVKDRKTGSSITIKLPNLSNLLGFIFYVFLSPAGGMKKHDTKIKCQCHLAQGTKHTWLNTDITKLNSDHVYAWYDPLHCDCILYSYEPTVCFEFCVANDAGEVDDSVCIKECGVSLVRVSKLCSVLSKLNLDSDKKKDLERAVELESNRLRNKMQNQPWESSEQSSTDSFDESESDSEMMEPDSAEEGNGRKDRYSEEIKSLGKEIKTGAKRSHGQISITESTNADKNPQVEVGASLTNLDTQMDTEVPKHPDLDIENQASRTIAEPSMHVEPQKESNPQIEAEQPHIDSEPTQTKYQVLTQSEIAKEFDTSDSSVEIFDGSTSQPFMEQFQGNTREPTPLAMVLPNQSHEGDQQIPHTLTPSVQNPTPPEVHPSPATSQRASSPFKDENINQVDEMDLDLDYLKQLMNKDPLAVLEVVVWGKSSSPVETPSTSNMSPQDPIESSTSLWKNLFNKLKNLITDKSFVRSLIDDQKCDEVKTIVAQIQDHEEDIPIQTFEWLTGFLDSYHDMVKAIRDTEQNKTRQNELIASQQAALEEAKHSKAELDRTKGLVNAAQGRLQEINKEIAYMEAQLAQKRGIGQIIQSSLELSGKKETELSSKCQEFDQIATAHADSLKELEEKQKSFDKAFAVAKAELKRFRDSFPTY